MRRLGGAEPAEVAQSDGDALLLGELPDGFGDRLPLKAAQHLAGGIDRAGGVPARVRRQDLDRATLAASVVGAGKVQADRGQPYAHPIGAPVGTPAHQGMQIGLLHEIVDVGARQRASPGEVVHEIHRRERGLEKCGVVVAQGVLPIILST